MLIEFIDTPVVRFNGNPACRMIQDRYYKLVASAALFLSVVFPDRNPLLNFGDACPRSGSCPNHPDGAHPFKGTAIDGDYPTLSGCNTTQYRVISKGPLDKIWMDDKLVISNFDWERTYIFWRVLSLGCPTLRIDTHQAIYDFMLPMIGRKYGMGEVQWFKKYVFADSSRVFNHKTHFHLRFEK